MSDLQKETSNELQRRSFLKACLGIGAAVVVAPFGFFFRSAVAAGRVACRKIKYPSKGSTMSMSDIGEIGKVDSIILEIAVMKAQNAFAGDELLNSVIRLSDLPASPINLFLKAQKVATLAKREAPKKFRDDWVMAALCKDIGKIKSPRNPSAFTASALRPYIDDSVYQVLKYYGTFEDNPSRFANRSWYRDALMFLDWNNRAVSQNFTPGDFEDFADTINDMVEVGLFKRPDDSKVIPTL